MSMNNNLYNFLKGKRGNTIVDNSVQIEKNVDTTKMGDAGYAINNKTYTISNITEPITDPLIVKDGKHKYMFRGVKQTSSSEAIAKNVEVSNI